MASEQSASSRLSSFPRRNAENGHATLSQRLSRAEYDELRGNGISGPFEGNSGIY